MSLASNNGGLLWIMLRSLAIASAKQHGRLIDRMTFVEPEAAIDLDSDRSRVPLSTQSLASGVFVAAPFEEDAERWDGLA